MKRKEMKWRRDHSPCAWKHEDDYGVNEDSNLSHSVRASDKEVSQRTTTLTDNTKKRETTKTNDLQCMKTHALASTTLTCSQSVWGHFAQYFVSSIQLLSLFPFIQFLTCTRIPCRDSLCENGSIEVLSLHKLWSCPIRPVPVLQSNHTKKEPPGHTRRCAESMPAVHATLHLKLSPASLQRVQLKGGEEQKEMLEDKGNQEKESEVDGEVTQRAHETWRWRWDEQGTNLSQSVCTRNHSTDKENSDNWEETQLTNKGHSRVFSCCSRECSHASGLRPH